ncbi:MAG: histidine-type phosphatase [Bacteroidales bacterium]|nr:histidine-type phosphatase [Bacteroidales bacterium]
MKRIRLALLCLLLLGGTAGAQTSREELLSHMELTAGNYANYPLPTGHLTPAPEGYEPFYISHYGRHGARYQTSDKSYRRVKDQLDSAKKLGILTEYGKDVRHRIKAAAADAKDRGGELTALGARQHRAIARRMYDNYPQLLSQPLQVVANSSDSRRVMLSMANFCNQLKSLNPALDISMNASQHDLYYIKSNKAIVVPDSPTDDELYRKLKKFRKKMMRWSPQMESMFTDPGRAKSFIDEYTFADDLYNIAADMYCLPELEISFDDVFGEEGMLNGFRSYNAAWCLWEGLMPGAKKSYYRIYPLLQNFLDDAAAMIASGGSGLRLRFGHDSVVLPFAFILGFQEATGATDDMENLHKQFSLFRLIPMAANIQLVFFRKAGSEDILVKFLMNENETAVPIATDCYPYYHWSDVEPYYRNMIESAHLVYQTPEEDED